MCRLTTHLVAAIFLALVGFTFSQDYPPQLGIDGPTPGSPDPNDAAPDRIYPSGTEPYYKWPGTWAESPIRINKPNNWSATTAAECPKKCQACCTEAWDRMSALLITIESKCKFCQMLRYTLGTWVFNSQEGNGCPRCLMDDFRKSVKGFRCTDDKGECSKCCWDLVMVWIARFQYRCAEPSWKKVADLRYTGNFYFDGTTTCALPSGAKPSPSPSPSPSPDPRRRNQNHNNNRQRQKENLRRPDDFDFGYDFEYQTIKDVGVLHDLGD